MLFFIIFFTANRNIIFSIMISWAVFCSIDIQLELFISCLFMYLLFNKQSFHWPVQLPFIRFHSKTKLGFVIVIVLDCCIIVYYCIILLYKHKCIILLYKNLCMICVSYIIKKCFWKIKTKEEIQNSYQVNYSKNISVFH